MKTRHKHGMTETVSFFVLSEWVVLAVLSMKETPSRTNEVTRGPSILHVLYP
jgi:uncharacterized protein with GYD domain